MLLIASSSPKPCFITFMVSYNLFYYNRGIWQSEHQIYYTIKQFRR